MNLSFQLIQNFFVQNYISKNIVYPFEAKVNNVQGTVYVQFAVDTSGRVTDVKVLRKVADDLDAEALRVVRNMPQWQPGEFQGEKVSIYYTVPIHFQLTD